jgi:ABC-type lipoprotein export system ATPase subunit
MVTHNEEVAFTTDICITVRDGNEEKTYKLVGILRDRLI